MIKYLLTSYKTIKSQRIYIYILQYVTNICIIIILIQKRGIKKTLRRYIWKKIKTLNDLKQYISYMCIEREQEESARRLLDTLVTWVYSKQKQWRM